MAKPPSCSGKEAIRAFEKIGFVVVRISGSHHVIARDEHPLILSVPVHGNRDISPWMLKGLIRDAGLTVDEFTALL